MPSIDAALLHVTANHSIANNDTFWFSQRNVIAKIKNGTTIDQRRNIASSSNISSLVNCDLEQLSYVLVYLINDSYPWMHRVLQKSKEKKFQFSQEAYQILMDERHAFINGLVDTMVEKQFVLCLRESLELNQDPNYERLQEIVQNL